VPIRRSRDQSRKQPQGGRTTRRGRVDVDCHTEAQIVPSGAREPIKPFLRWAGSKQRLLPRLRDYWTQDSRRYLEPFMGSASLFFSLLPNRAVLSDINAELVDTFSSVREEPEAVYEALTRLRKGKQEYYRIRSQSLSRLSAASRAARFIYLNRYCFNGIYRTNTAGMFNVPYAPSKTGRLPTLGALLAASQQLSRTKLVCSDFESVLTLEVRAGDFVYLDPPYAITTRRMFRQYGPKTFGPLDIDRLLDVLSEIDQRGAKFLLSYANNRAVVDKLSSWEMRRVVTQRNVSGFVEHRRKAVEVLVTNFPHPI